VCGVFVVCGVCVCGVCVCVLCVCGVSVCVWCVFVSAHLTQLRTLYVLILIGLYIKIKLVQRSKHTPSGL